MGAGSKVIADPSVIRAIAEKGEAARRNTTVAVIGNTDIVKFRGWLIRDLIESGHRVLACAPGRPTIADAVRGLGAEFLPISLQGQGLNPLRDAADVRALAGRLRIIGVDVALTHSTKANVIGTLAARLAGVPRIFAMIEGLGYAFTEGGEFKRRLLRLALSAAYGVALRLCDAVFVLNEDDLRFVRDKRLVGSRQAVVKIAGTGIDLDAFAASPPEAGPLRVLLIARLLREKGIGECVQAARLVKRRAPDSRFQVLGPFDDNPGGISREQIASWHDEGVIDYLGQTTDVRPYLRACSLYCLPSYYREGLPRTILEAMAIGRAIVTTDLPGRRETVINGVNGFLVPPRDPAALSVAIERFIEQPSLLQTMGTASRRLAVDRFDARAVNAAIMAAMGLDAGGAD